MFLCLIGRHGNHSQKNNPYYTAMMQLTSAASLEDQGSWMVIGVELPSWTD